MATSGVSNVQETIEGSGFCGVEWESSGHINMSLQDQMGCCLSTNFHIPVGGTGSGLPCGGQPS